MCMKYLNVTSNFYKSIIEENNRYLSFNVPFVSIEAKEENNSLFIEHFSILTNFNFLGTNNEKQKKENVLVNREPISVLIMLTKCSKNPENRLGSPLDEFKIEFENDNIEQACFEFYNTSRITNVDKIDLPAGRGNYVIKVLVKRCSSDDYTIQYMSKLIVT